MLHKGPQAPVNLPGKEQVTVFREFPEIPSINCILGLRGLAGTWLCEFCFILLGSSEEDGKVKDKKIQQNVAIVLRGMAANVH